MVSNSNHFIMLMASVAQKVRWGEAGTACLCPIDVQILRGPVVLVSLMPGLERLRGWAPLELPTHRLSERLGLPPSMAASGHLDFSYRSGLQRECFIKCCLLQPHVCSTLSVEGVTDLPRLKKRRQTGPNPSVL